MVAACPFPSARGSQVLIRETATALADRGHEVHVVTYPFGENLVPLRGLVVHRSRLPLFDRPPKRLSWRRKAILDIALMRELFRVVRRQRIEVLHAHNYEGMLVALVVRRLTGVPIVYHAHNVLADELPWYFQPRWRALMAKLGGFVDRHVPRRADRSIALATEVAEYLVRCGGAASRIVCIPPGGPEPFVPPEGLPDATSETSEARFRVVYAGNLDGYQDLDVLWTAFGELRLAIPSAELLVVTHDAEWQRHSDPALLRLLCGRGARVVVVRSFREVLGHLAAADVLLCPRRSWSGYPIKILNYLAAGRAVVVAEGAAKSIRHGENGLVFRNGNSRHLAALLAALARDPEYRQQLADAARATAAALPDWAESAALVERVYASICSADLQNNGALVQKTFDIEGLIAFSRDRISAKSVDRVG